MNQALTKRQQDAIERISEDETLTGALTDEQAIPLLRWAEALSLWISGEEAVSNEDNALALQKIRRAMRDACRQIQDGAAPEEVLQLAQAALEELLQPA